MPYKLQKFKYDEGWTTINEFEDREEAIAQYKKCLINNDIPILLYRVIRVLDNKLEYVT